MRAAAGHDPVECQKDIHRQAEYLRNLIAKASFPGALEI